MNLRAITTCLFSVFLFCSVSSGNQEVLVEKIDQLTNLIAKTYEAIKGVKSDMAQEMTKSSDTMKQSPVHLHDNGPKTFSVDPEMKTRDNLGTLGSAKNPFTTLSECIEAGLKPGDKCLLKTAAYDETIKINNVHGTRDQPIVIGGYEGETPVIGGTELINVEKWESADGKIYKGKVTNDQPIWQLFINGEMMVNARWPNAKWSDKTIFDGNLWSKLDSGSEPGKGKKNGYVKDSNLKDLAGKNIDGAMAILNIGSFNTFVGKVENFKGDSFEFKDTFGNYHYKRKNCRYFLEDKLDLLDSPEEWFYDRDSKMLYVYPPADVDLKTSEILGKVKTYALSIQKSSNIILKNLIFFASTLQIDDSDDITIESSDFMFPSYSKRMLGDASLIQWTKAEGRSKNIKFINNKFFGSDGTALYGGKKAENMVIENNLFEYNDWSGANMVKRMGGMATVKTDGDQTTMKGNTLNYNGASVGLRPGGLNPTVTMNRIKKQCWGVIQNDGAGIQLQRKPQRNSQITWNWVYDSPKYGIRYDGEFPDIGYNGNISFNVVWKCNGIMVKGENHTVLNNLAFEKRNAKDSDGQGTGCTICVIKKLRAKEGIMNKNTIVSNNAADVANGGVNVLNRSKPLQFSAILQNNVFNEDFKANAFVDLFHYDFRPMPDSKNVGPYKNKADPYWIPGRKLEKASFPIPSDGSNTIDTERRDVLIWQNAYKCNQHRVYFGIDRKNLEIIGTTGGELNVMPVPYSLEKGQTYFWRVDAVTLLGDKKKNISEALTNSSLSEIEEKRIPLTNNSSSEIEEKKTPLTNSSLSEIEEKKIPGALTNSSANLTGAIEEKILSKELTNSSASIVKQKMVPSTEIKENPLLYAIADKRTTENDDNGFKVRKGDLWQFTTKVIMDDQPTGSNTSDHYKDIGEKTSLSPEIII